MTAIHGKEIELPTMTDNIDHWPTAVSIEGVTAKVFVTRRHDGRWDASYLVENAGVYVPAGTEVGAFDTADEARTACEAAARTAIEEILAKR